MKENEWTERAGAKINLGLKILGKRSDGYHDILSVVQGIDLADTLHFRPAQHSSMTCTDSEIPCNGDNLVLRAMALFSHSNIASFKILLSSYFPLTGSTTTGFFFLSVLIVNGEKPFILKPIIIYLQMDLF